MMEQIVLVTIVVIPAYWQMHWSGDVHRILYINMGSNTMCDKVRIRQGYPGASKTAIPQVKIYL